MPEFNTGHASTKENTRGSGKDSSSHPPRILLLVSGSIAAYKSVLLLRQLQQKGMRVQVAATQAALAFVGRATWEGLTGHPLHSSTFAPGGMMAHIDLPDQADLVLLCPATANTLARLASGQAGDLISAICLAATSPLIIAPAMNSNMWQHPATQRNLNMLKEDGCTIVEPADGHLACGWQGQGRLAEIDDIMDAVERTLTQQDLAGKHILITAGPSREYLDPVRFLSNPSTGKMGTALAREAARRGASVDLLLSTGAFDPGHLPKSIQLLRWESTADLLQLCDTHFAHCDWMIAAAAVADYTTERAEHKQKKSDADLQLSLQRTPDVLAAMSARKTKKQKTTGFAAETNNLLAYGKSKLASKNLDAIVCNLVGKPDTGFASDHNAGILLFDDQSPVELPKSSKRDMARSILDQLRDRWND